MRGIKRFIVHCSDSEEGNATSIRHFHMSEPPLGRGWNDIAYHYVIIRDGTVEMGRSPDQPGAHCVGHNHDSLGICLIGREGRYTLKQFMALRELVYTLRGIYGVGKEGIYCHYELDQNGKTCPDINKADLLKFLNLP